MFLGIRMRNLEYYILNKEFKKHKKTAIFIIVFTLWTGNIKTCGVLKSRRFLFFTVTSRENGSPVFSIIYGFPLSRE